MECRIRRCAAPLGVTCSGETMILNPGDTVAMQNTTGMGHTGPLR